jgi:hypothetical protein
MGASPEVWAGVRRARAALGPGGHAQRVMAFRSRIVPQKVRTETLPSLA